MDILRKSRSLLLVILTFISLVPNVVAVFSSEINQPFNIGYEVNNVENNNTEIKFVLNQNTSYNDNTKMYDIKSILDLTNNVEVETLTYLTSRKDNYEFLVKYLDSTDKELKTYNLNIENNGKNKEVATNSLQPKVGEELTGPETVGHIDMTDPTRSTYIITQIKTTKTNLIIPASVGIYTKVVLDSSALAGVSLAGLFVDPSSTGRPAPNLESITISPGVSIRGGNSMFLGLSTLTTVTMTGVNTDEMTSTRQMFTGCSSLQTINMDSDFIKSGVNSTAKMFSGCNALESIDMSGFDMSNVTDMSQMFYYCMSLRNVTVGNLNTSQVTTMHRMFEQCQALESLDLSGLKTNEVKDMSFMFSACPNLTSINMNGWDTQKVTTMSNMFSGCTSLVSFNLNNLNTIAVTDMSSMFSGVPVTTFNFPSNFVTSSVTNMNNMFLSCSNLETIDLTSFDMRNVTSISGMFGYCSSLTSVNTQGWDTSRVTDMSGLFKGCSSITEINITHLNVNAVNNISSMFNGCTSLITLDATMFDLNSDNLMKNLAFSGNGNMAIFVRPGTQVDEANYLGTTPLQMTFNNENNYFKKVFYTKDEFDSINQIELVKTYANNIKVGDWKIEGTDTYLKNETRTPLEIVGKDGVNYEIEHFEITYDGNGSTSGTMDPTIVYEGDSTTLRANAYVKTGYTFAGWSKTQNGPLAYNDQATIQNVTNNMTLYAIWTANTYQVVFNSNKPSGASTNITGTMNNQSFTYDQAQNLTTNKFVLPGYTFQGWSTSQTGNVSLTDGQNITINDYIAGAQGNTINLYAKWSANTYTITFDANTGTGAQMPTQQMTFDGASQSLNRNTYTKIGYTFLGWSTSSNGTVVYTDAQLVKNITEGTEITLYAVWGGQQYSVFFDKNATDATGRMDALQYEYGKSYTLPTNTYVRNGYKFKNWNTQADGRGIEYAQNANVSNLVVGGSITLYAQWEAITYTVEFNGNGNTGGNSIPSMEFTYGVAQNAPANTYEKTGHDFVGWSTSQNGDVEIQPGGEINNLTTTDQATVILYAVWEPVSLNLNFDANGGQGTMTPQIVKYGVETAIKSNEFTNLGFTFAGWNTNQESANNGQVQFQDGGIITIQEETTLYAVWLGQEYTVVFDSNKGTGSTTPTGTVNNQTFRYNENKLLTSAKYEREGYTFAGWSSTAQGSSEYQPGELFSINALVGNANPENEIRLYAVWTAINYEVEFLETGVASAKMPNQIMTFDQTEALDKNTYTKEGYTFAGWSLDANSQVINYTEQQEVVNLANQEGAIVKLYAVWQGLPYVVHFDKNSAEAVGVKEDMKLVHGEAVLIPNGEEFTRTGHHIVSWNTESAGTGEAFTPGEEVTDITGLSNVTLYAQWAPNAYTIKFFANQGQGTMTPETLKATYGTPLQAPENTFTRTGYTFVGWSTNTNANEAEAIKPGSYFPNYDVVNNGVVNMYAIWKITELNITYDKNSPTATGTMVPNPQKVSYNTSTRLQTNVFTNVGYVFTGWNTKADGTGTKYTNGATVRVTKDITLYAQWRKITYNIIYNPNGGEGKMVGHDNVSYDEYVTLKENTFTRTGGTFRGWALSAGDEPQYQPGQQVKNLSLTDKATVTLYAVWDTISYNVAFDANGGEGIKPSIQVNFGSEVLAPEAPEFSKYAYHFIGWNTVQAEAQAGTVSINVGDKISELTSTPGSTVTLYAVWKYGNPDGSLPLPGVDGELQTPDDVIVKPGEGVEIEPNPDGSVTIPDDGNVDLEYPNNGTITPPPGSQVNPDGSITFPEDGPTIQPDNNGNIILPGKDDELGTDDDIPVHPTRPGANPEFGEDGSVTLPEGGTADYPNNGPTELPPGSVIHPDGTVTFPGEDGKPGSTVDPDDNGNIILPGVDDDLGTGDDVTVKPDGEHSFEPDGSVNLPTGGDVTYPNNGTVDAPAGSVVHPDGSITFPETNDQNNGQKPTIQPDNNGNIVIPGLDNELGTPDDVVVTPPANDGHTFEPNGDINLPEGGELTYPDGEKVEVPAGSVVHPNGSVTYPEEFPAGSGQKPTIFPDYAKPGYEGSTVLPGVDGNLESNNDQIIGDDVVVRPNEGSSINPDGSMNLPNGGTVDYPNIDDVQAPAGSVVHPDGSITFPDVNTDIEPDKKPTILPDYNGDILLPGMDGNLDSSSVGQPNNDDVIVRPEGDYTFDNDGNLNLPNGGTIIYPDEQEVTVDKDTIVFPDGTYIKKQYYTYQINGESKEYINGEVASNENGISEFKINSKKVGFIYNASINNHGWFVRGPVHSNTEQSITDGLGNTLEAITIELDPQYQSQYDVYYRVKTKGFGLLDWAKNGEKAGSEGYGDSILSIEIQVVNKGEEPVNTNGESEVKDIAFFNLGVEYRSHNDQYGWLEIKSNGAYAGTQGEGKAAQAFQVRLTNKECLTDDPNNSYLTYDSHNKDRGWMEGQQSHGITNSLKWVGTQIPSNNDQGLSKEFAGVVGLGLPSEAIKININGTAAKYFDIYYMTHVQNAGNLDWAKNGERAGSSRFGWYMEGFAVRLVPKKLPVELSTTYSYIVNQSVWYQIQLSNIGWTKQEKDAKDAYNIVEATSMEAYKLYLTTNEGIQGKIKYTSKVQGESGYLADKYAEPNNPPSDILDKDKINISNDDPGISGTVGEGKKLQSVKISLESNAVGSDNLAEYYDIQYRVWVDGDATWLGWAENGEEAGVVGDSNRVIKNIQIRIVPKCLNYPTGGGTTN